MSKKLSKSQAVASILLTAYLVFLTWRMFFFAYGGFYRQPGSEAQYNLLPLKTLYDFIRNFGSHNIRVLFYNLAGNIAVFIPLGFLLPFVIKSRRLINTVLVSFAIIMAAEIMQLITLRGVFDVDDIILNMLGCIIGFAINKIVYRKH